MSFSPPLELITAITKRVKQYFRHSLLQTLLQTLISVYLESDAFLLDGTFFPFPFPSNHCLTHDRSSELTSETGELDGRTARDPMAAGEGMAKPNEPTGSCTGDGRQSIEGGNGKPIGSGGGGQNSGGKKGGRNIPYRARPPLAHAST